MDFEIFDKITDDDIEKLYEFYNEGTLESCNCCADYYYYWGDVHSMTSCDSHYAYICSTKVRRYYCFYTGRNARCAYHGGSVTNCM